jgi:fructose-bisphosphate aldolase, class I
MLSKLEIQATAEALVADGKGILAADESMASIIKRFEPVGIKSTEENRRIYRELLFTAPEIENYISGVILFDETIRQKTMEGMPFPELLRSRGIIPGIKVDKGTRPLPGYPGEKITEGLDGLRERLVEYRALGARFTKWRAVFSITPGTPTRYAIQVNARLLALFARICQEEGLVPIVEPEVLMDGMHHLSLCEEVTGLVLHEVFNEIADARVMLECMLLKPNMILPGEDFPKPPITEEVADATLRMLRRSVPPAVPGIVFLSGGQTPDQATANLNAVAAQNNAPWKISFSFGRALQAPALETWGGSPSQAAPAQRLFTERARLNSMAVEGKYTEQIG